MRPTSSEFSHDIQPIWRVAGEDQVPLHADGSKFYKHFPSLLDQPEQAEADDGFALDKADDLCGLAAGALIATPEGGRAVEGLKVGDLVETMDHGPQPIRWIGTKSQKAAGDLAPIQVPAGVLGAQQTLKVGPQQRLHLAIPMMDLLFGFADGLAEAGDLVDGAALTQSEGEVVQYFQLLFDEHQIIWANGVATESLLQDKPEGQPSSATAPSDISRFFPDLIDSPPRNGQAARPLLERHEARVAMSYVKSSLATAAPN